MKPQVSSIEVLPTERLKDDLQQDDSVGVDLTKY